ncbi:MAG: phage replisome organizer N-terminal domain-containing protein, partial [Blautia sp.]|nr:phage replisome organizer N-terminal domain-containing protein [Blautia sp.]
MDTLKWIRITTNVFNDRNILMIEDLPDADKLIVIWFKLLCLAGAGDNGGMLLFREHMPYTEEMLAAIFRRPLNT